MSKAITLRLTDELAARLAERKKRTLVPTEAWIRQLIEKALVHDKIHEHARLLEQRGEITPVERSPETDKIIDGIREHDGRSVNQIGYAVAEIGAKP